MRAIREVIVVEGRYDKNALRQVVDATIIETNGFGVFNDREKQALLRKLAAERGLIILTDSDGAGFVIRNFLKGAVPKSQIKHAYIPDVYGKERRKTTAGKEGKIGVEGMRPDVLLYALERAGAVFLDDRPSAPAVRSAVTKGDFFEWGLTGSADSKSRREALLKKLGLPERMTTNAFLEAVNILFSKESFMEVLHELSR